MNRKLVGYWIATGLVCLVFTLGGIANLLQAEQQQEIMQKLGYPVYLMTLLGVAKLLAVMAILAPGRKLLKEWAYAGLTFDMIGASFSHASIGDPIPSVIVPLVVLSVMAASYALRPESRRIT